MTRTDEELVQTIRRGDADAFDQLYRRYGSRLFGYIRRFVPDRHAAEDLFQEVFLSVLQDRSFDLRERGFAGWLFTVARNRCLTQLRSERRQSSKIESVARQEAAGPAAAPSPEELLDRRQQLGLVESALTALSTPHQETFMLKQLGKLTYEEIAQIQGVPAGTVKSRLHVAVRAVQRSLLQQGESR